MTPDLTLSLIGLSVSAFQVLGADEKARKLVRSLFGKDEKDAHEVWQEALTYSQEDDFFLILFGDKEIAEHLRGLAGPGVKDVPGMLDRCRSWTKEFGRPQSRDAIIDLLLDFQNRLHQAWVDNRQERDPEDKRLAVIDQFGRQLERERTKGLFQPTELPEQKPIFLVPMRQNQNLVGAGPWLEAIDQRFQVGEQAIINQSAALTGQGGLGKTAMALEYAYANKDRYPGGVFWLTLDTSWESAVGEFSRRLQEQGGGLAGLEQAKTDDDYRSRLTAFLNGRGGAKLVVLDNLENPDLIRSLSLQNAHVLVTTRCQETPGQPVNMDLPESEVAAAIFLNYADRDPAELNKEQMELALKISNRADRLPLALEILGRLAHYLPWGELADDLDDFVSREVDGLSHQEKSVSAALALAGREYGHPLANEVLLYLPFLHPEHVDSKLLAIIIEEPTREIRAALAALAKVSVIKASGAGIYSIHRLTQDTVWARNKEKADQAGERVHIRLTDLAQDNLKSGIYKEANLLIPHLEHWVELASRDHLSENFPSIDVLMIFGEWAWRSGSLALSLMFSELVAAKTPLADRDKALYARCLNSIACVKLAQGNYEDAEELYRKALEIDEHTIGRNHPYFATSLSNLADALGPQGKYEQAEKLYLEALEINKKTTGCNHPDFAGRINNLGALYRRQKKYEQAEDLFRQTLEICDLTVGREHPNYAITLTNLAVVQEDQEKYEEAAKHYTQALDLGKKTIGEDHPDYATRLNNFACLYVKMERIKEARAMVEQAFRIFTDRFGPNHPHTKSIQAFLARLKKKKP